MTAVPRGFVAKLRQAVFEWFQQDYAHFGAGLAFYTLFALAPLFIIVLAVAGFWFGEEAARRELFSQLSGLVGSDGAEAIQAVVSAAHRPSAGIWATTVATVTLFVGATGVFVQLQSALNSIWGVQSHPERGIVRFIKVRLLSFGMVLAIGFLLLVSLMVSAALSALGQFAAGYLPAEDHIWQVLNFVVSFAIISLLFAAIFKVLPDVKITWREVWAGAGATALLFNSGKYVIGLYLGRNSVASAYGAAGSLVVVLLWVYYSAQILLFGAKLTQTFSPRKSHSK